MHSKLRKLRWRTTTPHGAGSTDAASSTEPLSETDEDLKYTVTVGIIGTVDAGPDLVEAEKKYAESAAAVDANPRGFVLPLAVNLLKSWEGKHGEAGEREVVKEQSWGL